MTKTSKLIATGVTALLAGVALMILLCHFAWQLFGSAPSERLWSHDMMQMAGDMPWFAPLGPLGMALTLAGIIVLFVSLVRLTGKTD